MARVYEQKVTAGRLEAIKVLKSTSPVAWGNVNLIGNFDFTTSSSSVDIEALAAHYENEDFWRRSLQEGEDDCQGIVKDAQLDLFGGWALIAVIVRAHFPGKSVVEGTLLLPMVLPGVALAVGMLAVVRVTPLWGSQLSLAVGHPVLSLPAAYLVLRASLRQVDVNLEVGGLWLRRRALAGLPVRDITADDARRTGCSAVLSRHLAQRSSRNLFLATRYTETLPRVIWPNLRFAITPLVAAASVILLSLPLPALIGAGWWLRRRN